LAAANANRPSNGEDDTLSDYVPDSRDLSVSRAVCCFTISYCVLFGEQQLTIQPSVTVDERHINTAPQSLAESDGEDELIDDDEEIDEDAIAGGSVS
jgi:SWI/SNF-related matrix-associated actin-dependent regulator of chromatin subfamily A member 5